MSKYFTEKDKEEVEKYFGNIGDDKEKLEYNTVFKNINKNTALSEIEFATGMAQDFPNEAVKVLAYGLTSEPGGIVAAYDNLQKNELYKAMGSRPLKDDERNFVVDEKVKASSIDIELVRSLENGNKKYELADHIARKTALSLNTDVQDFTAAPVKQYKSTASLLLNRQPQESSKLSEKFVLEHMTKFVDSKVQKGTVVGAELKDELKKGVVEILKPVAQGHSDKESRKKFLDEYNPRDPKPLTAEKLEKYAGAAIRQAMEETGTKMSFGQKVTRFFEKVFTDKGKEQAISDILKQSQIKVVLAKHGGKAVDDKTVAPKVQSAGKSNEQSKTR